MAKVLWLNPLTTGSTSLSTIYNPHDVEALGLTSLLEKEGHEVWLHESYTKQTYHSPWANKVYTKDLSSFKADIVLLTAGPFILDYMGYRFWGEIKVPTSRALQFQAVSNWLDSFDGSLYMLVPDPRPTFQGIWKEKKREDLVKKGRPIHSMYAHLDRCTLLVPDKSFLDPKLQPRAVISDYWKAVSVGEPLPFNQNNDYFCTYPGLKFQNGYRKKMVANWLDAEGCYTVGQLDLPNIPSATNYKNVPLSQVLDYTRRSTTALVCGEKTHTWLTPRVIQSMLCGTISSIHPEFAGSHHLPSELLADQTVQTASQFDVELSERVYNRQVEFIMSLRDSNAVSGVS
jgi:hypothetical protein